MNGNT